jgi:nucleotide-binding universal stress UspA family protein
MSNKEVTPTMLHSIICGVDGSEASRPAARVAARLADTLHVRLVLAHVTEDRPTFPYRDARLRELQRRHAIEDGQRLLESVAAELPGTTPELRVTFGTPVEALRALCSEESAELLIVGSRGRSPLAAAVLGSVSARLASTAECPVVVVSAPAAAERFLERDTGDGSILCGVDAFPASEGALHVAAALADRMALELVPVHVSDGRRQEASFGVGVRVQLDGGDPVAALSRRALDADGNRVGRFSKGIEQLPDSPDKLRRGRFSNGIEQLPDTPSKVRAGRFSEGIEHLPRTPARLRRGTFADGCETIRSRSSTRRR